MLLNVQATQAPTEQISYLPRPVDQGGGITAGLQLQMQLSTCRLMQFLQRRRTLLLQRSWVITV